MTAVVLRADARRIPLAGASVDLIMTSPPYFGLRSYQDGGEHYDGQIGAEPTPQEYVDNLIDCTREWVRVLKPTGSLWLNLGDKYSGAKAQNVGGANRADNSARTWQQTDPRRTGIPNKSLMGLPWRYALRCIDDLGLILRAEVIWSKPNGLPESVTDRVRRSHEHWFHLVKQPRYYSAIDHIRYQHAAKSVYQERAARRNPNGHADVRAHTPGQSPQGGKAKGLRDLNPLGALPGSVWEIATEPLQVPAHLGIDHFAAFPMEWPRRIILGWSRAGGIVLDPFGGTGTTALVAHALGRHGISGDMSADYCHLARWRTTDPDQLAKAMRVNKPPKQVADQFALDLFADLPVEASDV
jgi:DNA modification methylase